MKKMLASLNVMLISTAKNALIGYAEKRINKAVKAGDFSKECGEELKNKARKDIDALFEKIEELKDKFLGETEENKE